MPNPNASKSSPPPAAESPHVVIALPPGLEKSQAKSLAAYVVNSSGKVVEKAPFQDGSARLAKASADQPKSRVFIGPQFPADYPPSKIDVYALLEAGAYQVSGSARVDDEIVLQHLPSGLVPPVPILNFCEVQGNITNNLTVSGVPYSGPVCKARVHICAVEWFWPWPVWLRPVIPQGVLDQLKGSFLALRKGAAAARLSARPVLSAPKSRTTLEPLPADVESEILAATTENIQEVVFSHREILYPYLCWWPIFWPFFYRVVEEEVVYTDCNGHFDGWLVSPGGAHPWNVYVWVEACYLDGTWHTVYNPPFPCNTYWSYACGTEIDIALTDPNIPPCSCGAQTQGGTVWFTAIGAQGIALNIQQDVTSTALGQPNAGCTNLTDPSQLAPFAGQLGLYLAFGPTPPAGTINKAAATATHYRWTWTDLNESSPATPITGPLARPYVYPLPSGTGWESSSISLYDTDASGNIAYQIPNYDVTSYPGVPSDAEWVSFNFLSALLDSTELPNGHLIQFNLELLSKDSNGVFQVVSVPVNTFQVSNTVDAPNGYGGAQPAPYTPNGAGNNYLSLDPATSGNALNFCLKVMVDNSQVTAAIADACLCNDAGQPLPNGTSGPCGFIEFSDDQQGVNLTFTAAEPFNRATFSYSVTKGNSGQILSVSGYVFDTTPTATSGFGPFTLVSGEFSGAPTVEDLLGGCPQAAFAENLTVSSLATDGTTALSNTGWPWQKTATAAFALTPQPSSQPSSPGGS
jgi:hypothetical protein